MQFVVDPVYIFLALPVHFNDIQVQLMLQASDLSMHLLLQLKPHVNVFELFSLFNFSLKNSELQIDFFHTEDLWQQCKPYTPRKIVRKCLWFLNSRRTLLLLLWITYLLNLPVYLIVQGWVDSSRFWGIWCHRWSGYVLPRSLLWRLSFQGFLGLFINGSR